MNVLVTRLTAGRTVLSRRKIMLEKVFTKYWCIGRRYEMRKWQSHIVENRIRKRFDAYRGKVWWWGARANLEGINSRRRRCLIEPPARGDNCTRPRMCSRYGTGAIVPGTRTCGTEIPYSRDIRAVNSFATPQHRASLPPSLPASLSNPLFYPCRGLVGLSLRASCGRGILQDECPTTGLCGFSRRS